MNIRKTIQVKASQRETFSMFTLRHGQWWPPVGQPQPAPTAFIEPHVGGRWFERDVNQNDYVWGKVLAWNPPRRLLLSWQIGADGEFDPDLHTELELRFIGLAPDATLVWLEHRHLERYGHAAESQRAILASDVGWIGILEHFARHCNQASDAGNGDRGQPSSTATNP